METTNPNTFVATLQPEWNEIEHVRCATEQFLRTRGYSNEVIEALLMVSCELMENAVKYGSYQSTPAEITHRVEIAASDVIVEVTHPTQLDDTGHLSKLDSQIQWIRGFQNPFEAYVNRMREVSAKDMSDTESGLGLVRIAYEGQAVLDFFLHDSGVLSVCAVYRV